MLVAAGMSVGTLVYSLGVLLVRLAIFLTLPVSVLLLYPVMRANHRRWFKWTQEESQRRSALIAELTKQCAKPVDWPHPWPRTPGVVGGSPCAPIEPP